MGSKGELGGQWVFVALYQTNDAFTIVYQHSIVASISFWLQSAGQWLPAVLLWSKAHCKKRNSGKRWKTLCLIQIKRKCILEMFNTLEHFLKSLRLLTKFYFFVQTQVSQHGKHSFTHHFNGCVCGHCVCHSSSFANVNANYSLFFYLQNGIAKRNVSPASHREVPLHTPRLLLLSRRNLIVTHLLKE